MFGIGWPELLLIGIVALVAIGPKDLPPLMRQLGKWVRTARQMFHEFQTHIDDLPNQAGLHDMQKQADDLQRKTFEQFGVGDKAPPPPLETPPAEKAEKKDD